MTKSLKVLLIIWVLAGLSVVGAWFYIYKIMAGIEFIDSSKTLNWDEAVKSGGLSFETQKPVITAVNSSEMQLAGEWAEDSYTPSNALEKTGYFSPQVTAHNMFILVTNNPQGSK